MTCKGNSSKYVLGKNLSTGIKSHPSPKRKKNNKASDSCFILSCLGSWFGFSSNQKIEDNISSRKILQNRNLSTKSKLLTKNPLNKDKSYVKRNIKNNYLFKKTSTLICSDEEISSESFHNMECISDDFKKLPFFSHKQYIKIKERYKKWLKFASKDETANLSWEDYARLTAYLEDLMCDPHYRKMKSTKILYNWLNMFKFNSISNSQLITSRDVGVQTTCEFTFQIFSPFKKYGYSNVNVTQNSNLVQALPFSTDNVISHTIDRNTGEFVRDKQTENISQNIVGFNPITVFPFEVINHNFPCANSLNENHSQKYCQILQNAVSEGKKFLDVYYILKVEHLLSLIKLAGDVIARKESEGNHISCEKYTKEVKNASFSLEESISEVINCNDNFVKQEVDSSDKDSGWKSLPSDASSSLTVNRDLSLNSVFVDMCNQSSPNVIDGDNAKVDLVISNDTSVAERIIINSSSYNDTNESQVYSENLTSTEFPELNSRKNKHVTGEVNSVNNSDVDGVLSNEYKSKNIYEKSSEKIFVSNSKCSNTDLSPNVKNFIFCKLDHTVKHLKNRRCSKSSSNLERGLRTTESSPDCRYFCPRKDFEGLEHIHSLPTMIEAGHDYLLENTGSNSSSERLTNISITASHGSFSDIHEHPNIFEYQYIEKASAASFIVQLPQKNSLSKQLKKFFLK